MSTPTHTPNVTSAPNPPTRSHRVAGPVAWVLGTLATALSTALVAVLAHVVFVEWPTYVEGQATTALLIVGLYAVLPVTGWLLFLIPYVLLRRDGGVTRTGVWSAAVVGIAAGLLLVALLS